ncbi:hypothetical protein NA57DRAFT_54755 [Rhizodiscina lignyota]|uniref:SnoaL-like domain-containing protein n=1 Tax=Rhizodiscina lignyota TaxID=1504668 RepID=A0A9P4IGP1_9PEZI|nr:hypothetical protein NA57DRAFT_54755 [Rhizodiscina lignyota]
MTYMVRLLQDQAIQREEQFCKASSKQEPTTKLLNQQCITFPGPLPTDPVSSRALPASVSFMAKYIAKVDSGDLSCRYDEWYAPKAKFYNADGKVYNGGEEIWDWMRDLFGPFEKVQHNNKITRIVSDSPLSTSIASSQVLANGVNGTSATAPGNLEDTRTGDLFLFDTETTFWLKGVLAGEPIIVPRMLSFLVQEKHFGVGTDGLQIVEAKAWWDTNVLKEEVARRKQQLANH